MQVGEGGIILLPGATLDESLADDDDDWMLSLEGPPSPCDVVFINDNVLIDGRSSLSQKSKKAKVGRDFNLYVIVYLVYIRFTRKLDCLHKFDLLIQEKLVLNEA